MDSKRRIRCKTVFAKRLRFPFPRYGTNQVITYSKQHNSLIVAVANMMLYNAMQCDVETERECFELLYLCSLDVCLKQIK